LNALAILRIQVHRDRDKEFADNPRFALATNIEVYLCNPQSPRQRGSKVTFEEGPVLAQSGPSRSIAFNGAPSAVARASADKTSAQVPEKEWIDDSHGCGSLSW